MNAVGDISLTFSSAHSEKMRLAIKAVVLLHLHSSPQRKEEEKNEEEVTKKRRKVEEEEEEFSFINSLNVDQQSFLLHLAPKRKRPVFGINYDKA